MTDTKRSNVPPQGDRTPRGRPGGVTVPVPPLSSSDEGPSPGLTASPGEERIIAKRPLGLEGSRGGESSKVVTTEEEGSEGYPMEGVESGSTGGSLPDGSQGVPICLRALDEGMVFDGREIRWESCIGTPIYQWAFFEVAGKESRARSQGLARCFQVLDPELLRRETRQAAKWFRDAKERVDRREWKHATTYFYEAIYELCDRYREVSHVASKMIEENKRLREESGNLALKVEALKEKVVAASPQSPKCAATQTSSQIGTGSGGAWDSPGGVLGDLVSRVGSLEGKLDDLLARPAALGVQGMDQRGGDERCSGVVGVQVAPPPPPGEKASTPPAREGSKKKRRKRAGRRPQMGGPSGPSRGVPVVAPDSAAVVITVPEGGSTTYAQVVASARSHISLEEVDVPPLSMRRARTGGLILEIPGPDGKVRANRLAERLRTFLEPQGVRVARPLRTAEMRLRGLDDSATEGEVVAAISAAGGCEEGEVRVGKIRISPSSMGVVWARCPATAADRIAQTKKIRVGWASVTVEVLKPRTQRCFRCLEVGHVRAGCRSAADRSDRCYRCGGGGHRAAECSSGPCCPLCADDGRSAAHVLGGVGCPARPTPGGGVNSCAGGPSGGLEEPAHRKAKRKREEGMEEEGAGGGMELS